ncbi:MAG TPA: hypothetical protein VKM56_12830 [Verrucomicrobiae bacterium]|nr:hypothetical protein [Verrucomicrobiae bacterium]
MAFVIVIAFFNWMKRRSQSEDEPTDTSSERRVPPRSLPTPMTDSAPPPTTSKPVRRKIDWEAELRRMLEGNVPPPVPPRPVEPEARRAPVPSPPPVAFPSLHPAHPPIEPIAQPAERGLPVELAGLTVSAQSYQRASQLDEKVAEHLRQIAKQVETHAVTHGTAAASLEVAQTLVLLQNRQTLRSVIMASVILGPPKALEM